MQAKPILLDLGLFSWYADGYLTGIMVLFFDDVLQGGEDSFKKLIITLTAVFSKRIFLHWSQFKVT